MKKSILALAVCSVVALTACQAKAADYGTSWSTGTSSVTGYSQGASVTQLNSTTTALGLAQQSASYEQKIVSETAVGSTYSNFGSNSTFSSLESYAGGIRISSRDEVGTGYSDYTTDISTSGTISTVGHELSYVSGQGSLTGGVSHVEYSAETEYTNETTIEGIESYDFGSYSVTVGIR